MNPSPERRAHCRFPVSMDLEYWVLSGRAVMPGGRGKSVNMSSGGVLFRSAEPVPAGTRLELSIDWPARLDDSVGLKLRVTGHAIRGENGCTAVVMERYEFRTRRVRAAA